MSRRLWSMKPKRHGTSCVRHRRRRLSFLALALSLLAAAAPAEPMVEPGSRDSVLVIAPHPDDESLCCAGLLQRAARRGARRAIVWLTSGDGFELDAMVIEKHLEPGTQGLLGLAEKRMREARTAAGLLSVPDDAQVFLGYPDRGLSQMLQQNYVTPYRSRYTAASHVPYAQALAPGSEYTGRNLERDVRQLLDRLQPTLVLAPSPLDRHPDHRAAGVLLLRLMNERDQLDRLRFWVVHAGNDWPIPRRAEPGRAMQAPPGTGQLHWQSLALSAAEVAQKERAIAAHATQMKVMAPFLRSFVRNDEIFTADSALPSAAPR